MSVFAKLDCFPNQVIFHSVKTSLAGVPQLLFDHTAVSEKTQKSVWLSLQGGELAVSPLLPLLKLFRLEYMLERKHSVPQNDENM